MHARFLYVSMQVLDALTLFATIGVVTLPELLAAPVTPLGKESTLVSQ